MGRPLLRCQVTRRLREDGEGAMGRPARALDLPVSPSAAMPFFATATHLDVDCAALRRRPLRQTQWRWQRLPLIAAAVLAAQVLLPPRLCVVAASAVPSREELRKKTTKELKAILRSKGKTCKKCTEKDDVVDRVIETWDVPLVEAASPDGKVTMDKETFMKQMKMSYEKHFEDERKKKMESGEASGHQTDEAPPQMPDFEEVWRDFSEKLSKGEIEKDDASTSETPGPAKRPRPASQ
eukprot:TRINITY_DN14278_c0_g1_i2.p2 TRINITY_DN14278_c0_g1~~TRINITY_DN14278_c0_g1_i2.p2  ORF type:complete len:238 (+),score=56.57 TRINITY_DN14278_c0_g1_i2:19-732(+)